MFANANVTRLRINGLDFGTVDAASSTELEVDVPGAGVKAGDSGFAVPLNNAAKEGISLLPVVVRPNFPADTIGITAVNATAGSIAVGTQDYIVYLFKATGNEIVIDYVAP
jgi:hypothetical protein